jgi:hypothetical protein
MSSKPQLNVQAGRLQHGDCSKQKKSASNNRSKRGGVGNAAINALSSNTVP